MGRCKKPAADCCRARGFPVEVCQERRVESGGMLAAGVLVIVQLDAAQRDEHGASSDHAADDAQYEDSHVILLFQGLRLR